MSARRSTPKEAYDEEFLMTIATAVVWLCIGLIACALIAVAVKTVSLWTSISSQACEGCTNPTCFRGKECHLLEVRQIDLRK